MSTNALKSNYLKTNKHEMEMITENVKKKFRHFVYKNPNFGNSISAVHFFFLRLNRNSPHKILGYAANKYSNKVLE